MHKPQRFSNTSGFPVLVQHLLLKACHKSHVIKGILVEVNCYGMSPLNLVGCRAGAWDSRKAARLHLNVLHEFLEQRQGLLGHAQDVRVIARLSVVEHACRGQPRWGACG